MWGFITLKFWNWVNVGVRPTSTAVQIPATIYLSVDDLDRRTRVGITSSSGRQNHDNTASDPCLGEDLDTPGEEQLYCHRDDTLVGDWLMKGFQIGSQRTYG